MVLPCNVGIEISLSLKLLNSWVINGLRYFYSVLLGIQYTFRYHVFVQKCDSIAYNVCIALLAKTTTTSIYLIFVNDTYGPDHVV